jgi:hypothetical protein
MQLHWRNGSTREQFTTWNLRMGRRSFAWIRFWPSRENTKPGDGGLPQLPDTKKERK